MLSIKLSNDKARILPYCKKNRKIYHPGFYLYSAVDSENILAEGLFEIQSTQVEFIDYYTEHFEDHHLLDGILRAGFNYASVNGIHVGVVQEDIRERSKCLFDKLNFPNQTLFDINNFFSKYKNCNTL